VLSPPPLFDLARARRFTFENWEPKSILEAVVSAPVSQSVDVTLVKGQDTLYDMHMDLG
ncbi:hypothetical protein KIPB_017062, partial [Kipferlia bialata]